jgi:hypothetical protein
VIIAAKGRGVIRKVKAGPDVKTVTVSATNRDGLPAKLAERLASEGKAAPYGSRTFTRHISNVVSIHDGIASGRMKTTGAAARRGGCRGGWKWGPGDARVESCWH